MNILGIILMILGFGWAGLGIYTFVGIILAQFIEPDLEMIEMLTGLSFIMCFLFYWLPGIIVGGIGAIIRNTRKIKTKEKK